MHCFAKTIFNSNVYNTHDAVIIYISFAAAEVIRQHRARCTKTQQCSCYNFISDLKISGYNLVTQRRCLYDQHITLFINIKRQVRRVYLKYLLKYFIFKNQYLKYLKNGVKAPSFGLSRKRRWQSFLQENFHLFLSSHSHIHIDGGLIKVKRRYS